MRTPPKGRFDARFNFRLLSMASSMSERTIEISSMIIVSIAFTRRVERRRLMSVGSIRRGGNLKKEWIVCPPAFIAATPVGASTMAFSPAPARNLRNIVVLPVPARPVRNKLPCAPVPVATQFAGVA